MNTGQSSGSGLQTWAPLPELHPNRDAQFWIGIRHRIPRFRNAEFGTPDLDSEFWI